MSLYTTIIMYTRTMQLEHEDAEELKRQIRNIVGKYVDLSQYRLFVFGSRVDGRGDDRSDIDVGIYGPKPISRSTVALIQEEIDNLPYLYTIEFVDLASASEDFRQVALQHVEPIAP